MSHVLVAAVAVTACQGDEESTVARKTIGPDGGVISSRDGVLEIVLYPGALPEAVEIEIEPSDEPPRVFGPAYRVRPDIHLMVDADVTYRRVLPASPEGVAVAAIHREDFEMGAGSWVPLPRTELDVSNDLVTGVDFELSLFYAMLEDADGSSSTGTDSMGEGTGSTGGTGGSGETGFGPLSHEIDIQPIWDVNCLTNCHEPEGTNTDLLLTPEQAYAGLLDRFPVAATIPYVEPGDPSRSYLLFKLDGRQADAPGGGGSGMPLGAERLSAATRDLIEAWIEQGAPP